MISEYYKKKMSLQEIADAVKVPKQTIHNYVKWAKEKGIIKNTDRVNLDPADVDKALNKIPNDDIIVNKNGVNCTKTVARTCIYGSRKDNMNYLCEFYGCTGMLRTTGDFNSKDPKDCHCFQKATRENPRKEVRYC